MKGQGFRRDIHSFDDMERLRLVHHLWSEREANAEAAWRIGRKVEGYDGVGHWPHIHQPHDDLVDPLKVGRVVGVGLGLVAAAMITDEHITNPTLIVQAVSLSTFVGLSLAAEAAMSSWLPFFTRLEKGATRVARFGAMAGVPVSVWLGMRVPASPMALLAERWEGMALVAAELTLMLFAASAGSAMRAYSWSRIHTTKDEEFKRRLIDLGEDINTVEVKMSPEPEVVP